MRTIHSDEPITSISGPSIFLAGPTPRSKDVKSWRPEALSLLEHSFVFDGIVFVPERADKSVKLDYQDQVEWEYEALHAAQCIVFWVPRDLQTMPAFTTNVEMGYWAAKGKKLVYGRPRTKVFEKGFAPECSKNRYLDWLYGKEYGIAEHNIADCLNSVLSIAIGHLAPRGEASTFITADWHLGETRMNLMQRPFKSTKQQTEVLIQNHNSLVKPNDILIVNGDVITAQSNVDDMIKLLPVIARFNGKKTLIRGNHDRKLTDEQLSPYFERIVEDGGGLELHDDAGLKMWATHYPTQAKPDYYNLTGHIHAAWKVQKNMLNVGVDAHCFYPMPISQAAFYLKAVTEFYDDDVHASNHPANLAFADRGKKGRYFDVKGDIGGKPA